MWIVKIINYGLCVEWNTGNSWCYKEWQSFRSWTTYNDNFTLGQCSFSSTHKWCYTNNIHDFQRKESRFLSIFPYRECSVISVLYLCCLPGTGFLYNQSCDCVCDVMSDVPLYHATLWCPFYRCISHWSLSIKIHLSFIEPFASKWSPVLVWQAQIEL